MGKNDGRNVEGKKDGSKDGLTVDGSSVGSSVGLIVGSKIGVLVGDHVGGGSVARPMRVCIATTKTNKLRVFHTFMTDNTGSALDIWVELNLDPNIAPPKSNLRGYREWTLGMLPNARNPT